jgi:F-type H+-transporting ATPase subunit delta
MPALSGSGPEADFAAAVGRQSYAAVLERLDEYAAGATPEQLRTVADELLEVAGLLGREVALRRALSDPARASEDRVGLLRGLLADQLGEQTMELLDALVTGRWSVPSELLDATERLGVQALFASADRAGDLAEVEDELFRFRQVVAGDSALAGALGDRRVPVEQRATLLDSLLVGKASEVTVSAARVALGGFGGRGVEAGLTRLVELAAQRRDRNVAYVTVAAPLREADEQRLGAALSARYGRDVSVKTTVDPRVLGGVRVQLGADLYDGTIARRLAQARNALAR